MQQYSDEQRVRVGFQCDLSVQEWEVFNQRQSVMGVRIEEWLPELAPVEHVFSNVMPDSRRVVGFTSNVVSHFYPEAHLVVIDIIRGFCAGKSLRELDDIAVEKFPADHREVVNVWDQLLESENEQKV